VILMTPADPRETTANLLGPILMNAETRTGLQLVVVNPNYSTRYRVFSGATETSASSGGEVSPC